MKSPTANWILIVVAIKIHIFVIPMGMIPYGKVNYFSPFCIGAALISLSLSGAAFFGSKGILKLASLIAVAVATVLLVTVIMMQYGRNFS